MLFKIFQPRRLAAVALIIAFVSGASGACAGQRAGAQKPATQKSKSASKNAASKSAGSLSAETRAALERIRAESLRGHLSFIASDALEGRNTPSRGLDIAAEYIAAQFRRAGLEAVGDDGFFQTATMMMREPNMEGFELGFQAGDKKIAVGAGEVSLAYGAALPGVDSALDIADAEVVKVDFKDTSALAALSADEVRGKIVLTEIPDLRRAEASARRTMFETQSNFTRVVGQLQPALVVSVDRQNTRGGGRGAARLRDTGARASTPVQAQGRTPSVPVIAVHNAEAARLYDALKPGMNPVKFSMRVPAPTEKPVKLRNVVGLLRGSDPALRDTYVIVSAHYDHIGVRADGAEGDRIFNGANDDASGTVAVMELASALSAMKSRPRRSILFMTYFGEEKGLLGSRFYGRNPIFPIEKTIAHVNLEQVGRTDDTEGARVGAANLTGFDYSDLGAIFQAAGEQTGVRVFKHEANSDAYFSRSDNQSLADLGVPAHTLSVAYNFPDYHGTGDHWEKIDYANMEKIARMIAAGVLSIADNAQEPKWNEANPKAERYVKAWRERRGQQVASPK